jgi:hypothetical protein
VAAIVVAVMVWISKNRKSELGEEIRAREAAGETANA